MMDGYLFFQDYTESFQPKNSVIIVEVHNEIKRQLLEGS